MRRIAIATIGFVIAGAFYLLLIDTASLPELGALGVVALLAAGAFASARELGFTEASIDPRTLLGVWRALARVPLDIVILFREAAAQLVQRRARRGRFRAVPFDGGERPDDVGRRALAELFGSLGPNTIVIGVDTRRELLLVHQLRGGLEREEIDVMRLG